MFKIGDKVRCINNSNLNIIKEGDILTIKDTSCDEFFLSFEEHPTLGRFVWHRFEKIDPPVFKVGDKVRAINLASYSDLRKDKVYTVKEVRESKRPTDKDNWVISLEEDSAGNRAWYESRFEKVNELEELIPLSDINDIKIGDKLIMLVDFKNKKKGDIVTVRALISPSGSVKMLSLEEFSKKDYPYVWRFAKVPAWWPQEAPETARDGGGVVVSPAMLDALRGWYDAFKGRPYQAEITMRLLHQIRSEGILLTENQKALDLYDKVMEAY